jgi:hypothetical protein
MRVGGRGNHALSRACPAAVSSRRRSRDAEFTYSRDKQGPRSQFFCRPRQLFASANQCPHSCRGEQRAPAIRAPAARVIGRNLSAEQDVARDPEAPPVSVRENVLSCPAHVAADAAITTRAGRIGFSNTERRKKNGARRRRSCTCPRAGRVSADRRSCFRACQPRPCPPCRCAGRRRPASRYRDSRARPRRRSRASRRSG